MSETISFGLGHPASRSPSNHLFIWCGSCARETSHWLKSEHCDLTRDCYECPRCMHLVFRNAQPVSEKIREGRG